MKEAVLVMVGLVAGAVSVVGGLGVAALVLWWVGAGDEAVLNTGQTREAERQIVEINRRARDWIVADLLNRMGHQGDNAMRRVRERYGRSGNADWQ